MKKIFLLSVLFIFMGNVSANIELIETKEGILVYCIKNHVFLRSAESLVQMNVSVYQGRLASSNVNAKTRPMLCREYKKQRN